MNNRWRNRWLIAGAIALTGAVAACGDDDSPTTPPPAPPDPEPTVVAPAAPTGLSVTRSDGAAQVSWAAVSGAESYTVERRTLGSGTTAWQALATAVTGTSYTDGTAEEGVAYLYRVLATNSAGVSPASDVAELQAVQPAVEVLAGTIEGHMDLDASVTYTLQGIVTVAEGGELHIPAGTTILGSTEVTPTALIVAQGGTIHSEGTADAPVVFTSANPVGERRRGDWGGISIFGYSNCSFPADECIAEGIGRPYGGTDPMDSSGSMTYTRIEYCGFEVSFGNELNCLTLNGVGAGTELHHIQTHYGSDDGFEWFGGTVDLKYALATGISDDSFDYSTGWTGRGQFWIAQQDPDDADHGYEVDGNELDHNATPYTEPTIYNVTLVGGGVAGGNDETRGMLHRRGTGGHLFNHIVTAMSDFGLDIDNQPTIDRLEAGLFEIQNSIIFGNENNFKDDGDFDAEAIFMTPGWNNQVADPDLVNPLDRSNPDFRPNAGSPARGAGADPPDDGFFTTGIDYIGGVDPDGEEWYEGWTTFAQN